MLQALVTIDLNEMARALLRIPEYRVVTQCEPCERTRPFNMGPDNL